MIMQHLVYNHIPSIPATYVNAAEDAIDAVQSGQRGRLIELPSGVAMTAEGCVEHMHLEDFIEQDEE